MKTITIDGVKHNFQWEPSEQYLSRYRSMIRAQKTPMNEPAYEYRKWWENKHGKLFTGQVLKTNKDFNNYLESNLMEVLV